jgi:putative RecB family exonuclease
VCLGAYIGGMLARFSHSALGAFEECPQKFKFRYIDKADIPKRVFAHLQLGTIVHRQLATLYQLASDGKLWPLEDMLRAYDTAWEALELDKLEVSSEHLSVDDYIESGRRMLTWYYDRYQPFDQSRLLGAEKDIQFVLPGTRYNFTARIDRLSRRNDGVVELCDYKTGAHFPLGPRDPAFHTQMGLYQLAVQSTYPDFKEIELVQVFLKPGEEISYRMPPEELDELCEQFRVLVTETIHAERLGDWPTKESSLCDFCEYFALCPAKRHRLMLETESDEDTTTVEMAAELADRYVRTHAEARRLKSEVDALKADLIKAVKDLGVNKLSGREGDVLVRLWQEEKLPTKSADPQKFADLTNLIRQWGPEYEDYFKLDGGAVIRELYRKGRLAPDKLEQLKAFIATVESSRVTCKGRVDQNEE